MDSISEEWTQEVEDLASLRFFTNSTRIRLRDVERQRHLKIDGPKRLRTLLRFSPILNVSLLYVKLNHLPTSLRHQKVGGKWNYYR